MFIHASGELILCEKIRLKYKCKCKGNLQYVTSIHSLVVFKIIFFLSSCLAKEAEEINCEIGETDAIELLSNFELMEQ